MNGTIIHERPGVYSSYDASTAINGGAAQKVVAIAAQVSKGSTTDVVSLTGYAAACTIYGEDCPMTQMVRLLYLNGASSVKAIGVPKDAAKADYLAAFDALSAEEDVSIVLCDSGDLTIQQALRGSVEAASAARRERIAVAGGIDEDVTNLIARARALNSERVVLTAGDGMHVDGDVLNGVVTAAAVAGIIASTTDPAIPLNGAQINGVYGLVQSYTDEEIDLLIRGGVTPLECGAGVISVVRGVTTRTTSGGAPDTTWRELSTILIVDDVIPQIRNSLRRKFLRAKNTEQTRSAIRSQLIVELENKRRKEIIGTFGDIAVQPSPQDATVCEVEFSFSVVGGLNQIYLTAHITV